MVKWEKTPPPPWISHYNFSMNEQPLLESQRLNQTWMLVVQILLVIIACATPILAFITKSGPLAGPLLVSFFVLLVAYMLRSIVLKTEIRQDMIRFRFFPIHLKWKTIEKKEIEGIAVIKYDPIADYGGWGIRIGPKGWAYTTKGIEGVYMVLMDGRRILLGTDRPEAVRESLIEFGYPLLPPGVI